MICFAEVPGRRDEVLPELKRVLASHYVSPEITARRLVQLGAPETAKLFEGLLPESKRARSGDLGEILATELAEWRLGFEVPIRRLRWKDDREMALRGDDLVGVKQLEDGTWTYLKGEAKSRGKLAANVVAEASAALDKDDGRPGRHAVLFVASRLSELGRDDLAGILEGALLESFEGATVEHLLFTASGNEASALLKANLEGRAKNSLRRHAMGVHLDTHADLVRLVFDRP